VAALRAPRRTIGTAPAANQHDRDERGDDERGDDRGGDRPDDLLDVLELVAERGSGAPRSSTPTRVKRHHGEHLRACRPTGRKQQPTDPRPQPSRWPAQRRPPSSGAAYNRARADTRERVALHAVLRLHAVRSHADAASTAIHCVRRRLTERAVLLGVGELHPHVSEIQRVESSSRASAGAARSATTAVL
jgi:hypothetical protein